MTTIWVRGNNISSWFFFAVGVIGALLVFSSSAYFYYDSSVPEYDSTKEEMIDVYLSEFDGHSIDDFKAFVDRRVGELQALDQAISECGDNVELADPNVDFDCWLLKSFSATDDKLTQTIKGRNIDFEYVDSLIAYREGRSHHYDTINAIDRGFVGSFLILLYLISGVFNYLFVGRFRYLPWRFKEH